MQQYVIGIDIGGTNFRIGLVDKDGTVTGFEKKSSDILKKGDGIESLVAEIESYMEKRQAKNQVMSVALGFPSIVSKDKRMLYNTPNLKGFDGIDLKAALEERLGKTVFIDRDVNFLLQNDIRQLALDPSTTILGFYVGTGFGNAVYIDGKFYGGKNGVAGELGHIPLYGVTEQCTCGNVGCSETRCSGRYLEELVNHYFPETKIFDVFIKHGTDPKVRQFVRDLAIPIATEINILDPEYSIIAGGVVFMEGFPKGLLEETVMSMVRHPYPAENLKLLFSEHTQQSGVLGSGLYVHNRLEAMEKQRQ